MEFNNIPCTILAYVKKLETMGSNLAEELTGYKTFLLLSPIILSFLLILLISLAVNPVILRMRAL